MTTCNIFDSKTKFEGDGLVDDDESILDLAISKYKPVRLLKWHYRSNHESLINFSNYHFYNNQLIIPPSPNDKFAVNHHYTSGMYQARESKNMKSDVRGFGGTGGTNQIECEEICKGVVDHMTNKFDKSCLVVTMNDAQRIEVCEFYSMPKRAKEHEIVPKAISKKVSKGTSFDIGTMDSNGNPWDFTKTA